MKNKRFFIILLAVMMLLFIPFIMMKFTDEVNWNLFDFVLAGILLIGSGLVFEIIIRKVKSRKYRIVLGMILLFLLLLIWAEIAVGIFGTPIAGN